jgi:hypothetical protein
MQCLKHPSHATQKGSAVCGPKKSLESVLVMLEDPGSVTRLLITGFPSPSIFQQSTSLRVYLTLIAWSTHIIVCWLAGC